MNFPPRQFLHLAAIAAASVLIPHNANTQGYPTRPLTLVVPFAAGGPLDVAGRIIGQGLSEILGQQVIVENTAGAGGTIGSLRVARAKPDGYQFVLGNSGPTFGANRFTNDHHTVQSQTSRQSAWWTNPPEH